MRDLSSGEVVALRTIGDGRPVRYRYTPRGSSRTVLPSHVAILEARGLVDHHPRTDTYSITDTGRELLDRLDQGAAR